MNIKYEGLNHFTAEDARKRSYRSEIDRIIEYLNMCASRGLFTPNTRLYLPKLSIFLRMKDTQ